MKTTRKRRIRRTKNNASNAKNKNVNAKNTIKNPSIEMSKLEYEQSMMDPRFRAIMSGFNNLPNITRMNENINNYKNDNNNLLNNITKAEELHRLKEEHKRLSEKLQNEKMERLANEKINDTQQKILIANAKKEADDKIDAIRKEYNTIKNDNEIKQIIRDETNKYNKELFDKHKNEMIYEFQQRMNPIKESNEKLKNDMEIMNTKHKQLIEEMNATHQKKMLEMNNNTMNAVNAIENRCNELKNIIDETKNTYESSKQMKQLEHNHRMLEMQQEKNTEIYELQMENINLDHQKQIREDENALNKKIVTLKNDIEVKQQNIDKELIEQHARELLPLQKEIATLKYQDKAAQSVVDTYNKIDVLKNSIAEKGVELFGDIFDPSEIGKKEFLTKIQNQQFEAQKKVCVLENQRKQLEKSKDFANDVANAQYKYNKSKAELDAITSGEIVATNSVEAAQKTLQLNNKTKQLEKLREDLSHLQQGFENTYTLANNDLQQILQDNPSLKRLLQRVNNKKEDDEIDIVDYEKGLVHIDNITKHVESLLPGLYKTYKYTIDDNGHKIFNQNVINFVDYYESHSNEVDNNLMRNNMQKTIDDTREKLQTIEREKNDLQMRCSQKNRQLQLYGNLFNTLTAKINDENPIPFNADVINNSLSETNTTMEDYDIKDD